MAIRYRNVKGQFSKEGKMEKYNPKTGRTIWKPPKRKIPEPKHKRYIYILSFDYTKKGAKGKHPFHSEIRFESPHEMTNSEIWDFITSRETELPLGACDMKVKGVEIEESDYETEMPIVKLAELTCPMQNENIYSTKTGWKQGDKNNE